MASDEEVESFEITDFDLQSELNPGGARRKQTKEQAIYGVWANSDDENEGHRQRASRKKDGLSAQPMGFVSGGVFNDKDEEEEEGDEKKENEHEDILMRDPKPKRNKLDMKRQVKDKKKFGAWEKYTTGFGSRMLEKMGYTGKGLGKKGEGIVEPVQAFKRGGRGAIGAYGSEIGTKEPVYDTDEEEEQEIKKEIEKLHQWKKTGEKTEKPKYVYKTADEVKKEGGFKKIAPLISNYGNVKVVDMTGRQTKVLQGYNAIGNQHAKPGEGEKIGVCGDEGNNFDIPELIYNLNLLVDLAESEIIQIDRQLNFERDNVVNYQYEHDRLEKIVTSGETEITNLERVVHIVDRCKEGKHPDREEPLTLEGLIDAFRMLREEYYEEYKMYTLDKLVVPLGFPLLAQHFSNWNMFQQPTRGLREMELWKRVLEEEQGPHTVEFDHKENRSMGAFERLVWDVWMPHLRTAVGVWQPRNPQSLVQVLEAWVPLLPDWVVANILDQLLIPKLQAAVDFWDPLTDHVPIHSWIHPWLPLMADRLEPLYAPIRQKLSICLQNWHASDKSAKIILEPWVKVFSRGTMEAFLIRSIYPKLENCMSGLKINPHQQQLEPFHWVMEWKDIISVHHMVSILEKHFFPKWIQVLRKWLLNAPNYDEITKWYLGWKNMFGADMASNPSIKENFNRALTLMNQAVGGTLQPGAKENIAYLTSTERRKEAEQAFLTDKAHNVTSQTVPARFTDLVEKAAGENGILFIPLPNRRHEGRTVYSFGKSVIYIDRDVIFTSQSGQWKPVALPDLITASK